MQEHLVRENAPALAMLRAGFAFPAMHPAECSWSERGTYYSKDREMARVLRLEGHVQAAQGSWGGAVSSDLDTIRLGQDIPRGSALIGMLVGVACQAIGRRDIWDDAAHLSALEAKNAARRLEGIAAHCVPCADVMQQEGWLEQSELQQILHSPDWRKQVADIVMSGRGTNFSVEYAALRAHLLLTSPAAIADNFTHDMDRMVHHARQPYAAKLPSPEPLDTVSAVFLPNYSLAQLRDTSNQTQNALLTVTFALHAYRLEHGKLPDKLTALVPMYLSKVPDDPFALSGPLRYRRMGSTYLLYSIGPDGKDDGGKAIFDSTVTPSIIPSRNDRRRYTNKDSVGDVVAGVNIV